jgi:hypothetical protein
MCVSAALLKLTVLACCVLAFRRHTLTHIALGIVAIRYGGRNRYIVVGCASNISRTEPTRNNPRRGTANPSHPNSLRRNPTARTDERRRTAKNLRPNPVRTCVADFSDCIYLGASSRATKRWTFPIVIANLGHLTYLGSTRFFVTDRSTLTAALRTATLTTRSTESTTTSDSNRLLRHLTTYLSNLSTARDTAARNPRTDNLPDLGCG